MPEGRRETGGEAEAWITETLRLPEFSWELECATICATETLSGGSAWDVAKGL